jgi:hypothetical protein
VTVSQDQFRTALLDADHPVPDGLIDGSGRPAGTRFNVYRNTVIVSLIEALRVGFPIVTRILGRGNMEEIARIFVRAHPPQSPVLMRYGAAFPEFLSGLPQLSTLGYLPDIARLELALRNAYHAADAPGLDPAILANMPPDALLQAKVVLAPAVAVLRSNWPIFDIWRFNTLSDAVKPRHMAQDVLVTRPDFDPDPQLLPPGGATWITALAGGATIGGALDAAQGEAPDFDLAVCLTLLLSGHAMTALTPKD